MADNNASNNTNNDNQAQTNVDPVNNQPAAQNTVTAPTQTQNTQTQQSQTTQENNTQGKVFTQEEVNAIAARQKKEGEKAVLNKYGLTEEQIAGIAQVLNPQPQASTATTQATVPAVDNTESLLRVMRAETKAELAIAGVKADKVDAMVTLATEKLKPEDYTQDQIKKAVEEIKTMFAESFGTQTNIKNKVTGTGNNFAGSVQTTGATTIGTGEPGSIGKMLANKKNPKLGK